MMLKTKRAKEEYIANAKYVKIVMHGCSVCRTGKAPEGFVSYWEEHPYEPRRFVFRYTDPRASDVPVSKLALDKTTTQDKIDEALARCVILCRTCAKPESQKPRILSKPPSQERNDLQCQTVSTSTTSPSSS
ncbi:hypothetical protein LCGC14_1663460 [marine sediment metagenome]|uniref:Uncharacterized protein n=1 Tax=marine sediment metagenome TaxID=412755 RepID=A0A0F9K9A0_9ZZZZ